MTFRLVWVGLAFLLASTAAFFTTRAGAALLYWGLEAQGRAADPAKLKGSADAIAVLGGRTARIHHGARLHLATGIPLLITGKGTGDSGFEAESEKMEDILLRRYGVGPRWVETESRDTHQNAAFSWCLVSGMGVRRIALVTEAHHMPRARAEFWAAGFQVIPAPTPDSLKDPKRTQLTGKLEDFRPSKAGLELARRPLLEWAGMLRALLAGALLPAPDCP